MNTKSQRRQRLFAAPPDAAYTPCAVRPPAGLEPPAEGIGGSASGIPVQPREGLPVPPPLHIPGLEPITADLLMSKRRARRECGEKGHRLAVLDGWSELLGWNYGEEADFVTLTWNEKNGKNDGIYTPKAAFRKTHKVLKDAEIRTPSFLVTEPHQWRDIVHIHGLTRHLESGERNRFFLYWLHSCGTLTIRRSNAQAVPYLLKYLFKETTCGRYDWIDLSGLRPRP